MTGTLYVYINYFCTFISVLLFYRVLLKLWQHCFRLQHVDMHSEELIKLPDYFSSHTSVGWAMPLIWMYRFISWTGIKPSPAVMKLPKNQSNSLYLETSKRSHIQEIQTTAIVHKKFQCSMTVQKNQQVSIKRHQCFIAV